MKTELKHSELKHIKKGYFNILALLLEHAQIESKFVKCLLKWGMELKIEREDLMPLYTNIEGLGFQAPSGKKEKIDALYHLVYLIYLDQVIEDTELELAGLYAKELGFEPGIVGEIFQDIATAPFDGLSSASSTKKRINDFLELNGIT